MNLDDKEPGMYAPLMKLGQLALSNVTEGIPRSDAEKLLKAVVKRADEINKNTDQHNCAVDCIVVFGSYLTPKDVLGDLDIGVEVRPLKRIGRLPGQSLSDFLSGVGSPRNRVLAALRLRKPRQISLHELDEVISLDTPYQVVLGELPERYVKHA